MTYNAASGLLADANPTRPAPLVPLARWQFARLLETLFWFTGIVIAALPLLVWFVVDRYGDQLVVSIWEQVATNAPAWFLFAFGAKAMITYLPLLVTMGATRSRHVTASVLALAVGSLSLAVFFAAGMLFESALYRGYGLEQALTPTHLYGSANDVGLVIGEYALRYLVFALAGMLTGLAYYRFSGLIGTALLVFTLIPVVIAGALMSPASTGLSNLFGSILGSGAPGHDLTAPAIAVRLALAAALAILTFYLVRFLASRMPLRTKVG